MGYTKGAQVTLYGMTFHLISDPFCIGADLVFVDAEEAASGKTVRIRLPRTLAQSK